MQNIISAVIAFLIWSVVALAVFYTPGDTVDIPEQYWTVHTIESGDTLWEIARASKGNTRDIVFEIEQRNPGLDAGRLIPGQRILVPATPGYLEKYAVFGIPEEQ